MSKNIKMKSGAATHWLQSVLGLIIVILWIIFCSNSEIDRTDDYLVISKFFLDKSISVWVFIGVGVVLFFIAVGLFTGLARFLEDRRDMAYGDKKRAKKLNTLTVIVGLVLFIALIGMIAGAVAVLTSSGGDSNRPGTYYYYY
jgi:uncharacterized membrane protein YidH (DUF202 family)